MKRKKGRRRAKRELRGWDGAASALPYMGRGGRVKCATLKAQALHGRDVRNLRDAKRGRHGIGKEAFNILADLKYCTEETGFLSAEDVCHYIKNVNQGGTADFIRPWQTKAYLPGAFLRDAQKYKKKHEPRRTLNIRRQAAKLSCRREKTWV